MKINFAQVHVIKQLKLSPEILVLQRQIPDDNTVTCYKKIHIIPRGVSHVTRSLHFFHQRPQAKKSEGNFFQAAALF